ncbi:hypothetical protein PhCBS80983_g03472 [Powellomyces hirtus]|uniref:OPT family small oligopeptide transporter n=1 Tax=Powellomyces hirtus TaxID=109895 RepID=A0A507E4D2_9FUNG|nr:hypothetical protein PhCBS80983_g03472 [Powellomyces hirtus]
MSSPKHHAVTRTGDSKQKQELASTNTIAEADETARGLILVDTDAEAVTRKHKRGVWDFIDSVVDKTDDPSSPSLTPRVWLIGTFFTVVFAIANTILTFRTNVFNVPAVVAILLSLPCGKVLAAVLPKGGRFNPGPFSIKEHVLCGVMIGSAFLPLGVFNFISQKYILKQSDLSVISGVGFVLGSQMIGYGLAGHCRRFLVKPASMLWPTALTQVALYKALNKVAIPGSIAGASYSTGTFFWIAFTGAAIYQWFPSFLAPLLSTLSILCVSSSRGIRLWGSGFPGRGMGFLSINLDWSLIARWTPLESPFWTKVNQFTGIYLVLYVVVPILYYKNAFGMDQSLKDPMLSPYGVLNSLTLFNKTGAPLRPQMLVSPTGVLIDKVYEANQPIYISTFYAMTIALALFGYTATLCHTFLWYGKEMKGRLLSGIKEHKEDDDVHSKLMKAYPDVPLWWFAVILAVAIPMVMVTCEVGGFALSWWGVLVAIAFAVVSMVPVGVLQALSGTQLPLQTISLFLSGIFFQGQTFAVLSFNTVAYMGMAQGLVLVQDLKIAHYMKIPPRDMFIVQLYGKFLCAIIMTLTAVQVMENWQTSLLTQPQWQYVAYRFFTSNAVIWGSIGTLRFFGSGTPYSGIFFSLLAGILAPVIPWLCYRRWGGKWKLVNIPLMAMTGESPGSFTTTVSPIVISFLSAFYMKRYHHGLWSRYNYILAAALSAGTAITVLFIAVTLGLKQKKMPTYFLNPLDGEHCSP